MSELKPIAELVVGDQHTIDIRRSESFAYMSADSVAFVAGMTNTIEMVVMSHRTMLGHQIADVVAGEDGSANVKLGGVLSGPDIVHVGTVRVSRDGALEMVGLLIQNLLAGGLEKERIQARVAEAGI